MKKTIFAQLVILTICSLFIAINPISLSARPVDDIDTTSNQTPEEICAPFIGNTSAYQACLDNSEAAAGPSETTDTATGNNNPNRECATSFLGFPAWYDGLTVSDTNCDIKIPQGDEAGLSKFIWRLALNILQIAMVGAAYVTTYFIIYGGLKYLTSRGSADGIAKGKASIINAVIGLVIVLVSIAAVNLIINGLGL